MKASGNSPPATVPLKGAYMMKDLGLFGCTQKCHDKLVMKWKQRGRPTTLDFPVDHSSFLRHFRSTPSSLRDFYLSFLNEYQTFLALSRRNCGALIGNETLVCVFFSRHDSTISIVLTSVGRQT